MADKPPAEFMLRDEVYGPLYYPVVGPIEHTLMRPWLPETDEPDTEVTHGR